MVRKLFVVIAIAILFVGVQGGKASADVKNGGFESGDFAPGWTLSGDTSFAFVSGGGHSGSYEALLGTSGGTGILSQSIATTAGQTYSVSFWLANDRGSNEFQVFWNGISTPVIDLANSNAFDYNLFQFTGAATGASTTIAFDFQNDSVFHLDDVTANPVPEPSTFILFGAGLAGLGGFRFTMKKVA
jgi:hypothetical protein